MHGRLLLPLLLLTMLTGCALRTPGTPTALAPTVSLSAGTSAMEVSDGGAVELLADHGWTVLHQLSQTALILPDRFIHEAGDFPIPIFWAYHNELSRAIGLDISPYLGQPVTATILAVQEPLPDFLSPYSAARAVVITSEAGRIIGAWIDGRQAFIASSLDRQAFRDITHETWEQWLISSGVVDMANPLEQRLAAMSPEEIVTTYYEAIDQQDFHLAYATMSRAYAMRFLSDNLSEAELYNASFAEAYSGWPEVITKAQLVDLRPISTAEFRAQVAMEFRERPPALDSAERYTWFLILANEVEDLGWRIQEIGTGP